MTSTLTSNKVVGAALMVGGVFALWTGYKKFSR